MSQEVAQRVHIVRDDPALRVAARRAFYDRYGFGERGSGGFGRAEIDFMEWQRNRGLFAREDGRPNSGSPYWRATNECVAIDSEWAAAGWEKGLSTVDAPPAVVPWLQYFAAPTGASWYRAHNTSIVLAMVKHVDAALKETAEERRFINECLYRVIHAEALLSGALLGRVGRQLGDPRGPAVRALVQVGMLYPMDYPVKESRSAQFRRAVAKSVQGAGSKLASHNVQLQALVVGYLRHLAPSSISDADLFDKFVKAIPIYPMGGIPAR
ncbi:MAG: hypothetical protein IPK82_40995 [Polyangiaceae bacterium]|nr:hypothetical protein [Polyangiaceae bacterium]